MSNFLQGAAANAYPRDNFRGESSDQSFSYPNSQKQQISQSQGYPPKDDNLQFPYSSQQSLPSVQVLPSQQILPKNGYLPPSSQTSDGSHQSSHQFQQQQQLPSVRALPLPQNPPKSNNHPPTFQTSDQSQKQEPLIGVRSQGYSTKDNHDLQSHRSFNHPQHHQQQPSSPQVPFLKQNPPKNDPHPLTSSNQTSHESQPKQPPNGVPLETRPTKDHLQSNQPQKQQPPIDVPSKDQHPSKNKNQSQQQLPSALPPPKDSFLVSSSLKAEQPEIVGFAVPSTTQGNRSKPQKPTVQADPPSQPEKDEYRIKYAESNEPVLAYPDPSCVPKIYLIPMYEAGLPPPPPPLPPSPPPPPPPPPPPQRCCDRCSIL